MAKKELISFDVLEAIAESYEKLIDYSNEQYISKYKHQPDSVREPRTWSAMPIILGTPPSPADGDKQKGYEISFPWGSHFTIKENVTHGTHMALAWKTAGDWRLDATIKEDHSDKDSTTFLWEKEATGNTTSSLIASIKSLTDELIKASEHILRSSE